VTREASRNYRWRLTAAALFVSVIPLQSQQSRGAKAMFYDPAWAVSRVAAATSPERADAANLLRPVDRAAMGPTDHVGIHYWFENDSRNPMSARDAAAVGGRFTLHMRSNAAGFFTVWAVEDAHEQLTPMQGRYAGFRVSAGSEYVVPVGFVLAPDARVIRFVVVFSRSQTEQPGTSYDALKKHEAVFRRIGCCGPQIKAESEEVNLGEKGTYVVNQDGGPVTADIALRAARMN
jgi:hypothetical protein